VVRLSGDHKLSSFFRWASGSDVPRKSLGAEFPYWRHSQAGRNEPKKSDFEHEFRDRFDAARPRPGVTHLGVRPEVAARPRAIIKRLTKSSAMQNSVDV